MARKRQAVSSTPPAAGRRRSTRIGSAAGQTSRYFAESSSESDGEAETTTRPAKRAKTARRKAADSSEDDYEEEGGEEDKEDDEDDDDGDGGYNDAANDSDDSSSDAPPKVTFVPHTALRDLGGVAYAAERVHPVTLAFLRDLKANNRRSWLKAHDGEFRRAQRDWLAYVEALGARLAAEADDTLPEELPAKDVVFRIYRDVRFSRDPSPYKPHFSAAWSRTGKKGPYACYYVHCEPGRCFVGGGLWHPDADALRRLRASIDERPQRWNRVLVGTDEDGNDTPLRRIFLPAATPGDARSIKAAFAQLNAEGALKKKPLGYAADHRDIALLKLRNFTLSKKIPDAAFTDPDGQDRMLDYFKAMVPYVTHLNRIVRPDPGDEEEEEEEEGGEEADDDDDEQG